MPLTEAEYFSIQGRCCGLFKEEGAEAALSCLPNLGVQGRKEPKEKP